MTEAEAKTKVCCGPLATIYGRAKAEYGAGETTISVSGFNCIGSECMAWRWGTDYKELERSTDGMGNVTVRYDGNKFVDAENGYCGLAGKP